MKKNNISLFTNIFDDGFPFFSLKGDSQKLRTNIKENEEQYLFYIDVAGVPKDSINITVDDGYMTVEIKESFEKKENNDEYIRKEIYFGSCSRSYYIGDIKEEKISAAHQDGLLTIIVPKSNLPESKKSISIN